MHVTWEQVTILRTNLGHAIVCPCSPALVQFNFSLFGIMLFDQKQLPMTIFHLIYVFFIEKFVSLAIEA